MEGRRRLFHAGGEERPDVRIGRQPRNVQREKLVVPEKLVPRQRGGDGQVGDREDREDPDLPALEPSRQRAVETI